MKSLANKGFTLVELMVALVIAGLFLTAGVPRLASVFTSFSSSSSAESLMSSLAYARGQAVFLQAPVSICSGVGSCANSKTWSSGWTVFFDANGDGLITNGADEVLKVVEPTSNKSGISFVANSITFDRLGENSGSASTDFKVCATTGTDKTNKTVTVSPVGYVSSSKGASCS